VSEPVVSRPCTCGAVDPRAVEWGLDGGVRPEWVVAAALDLFLSGDVNDQVLAVEDVMARLMAPCSCGGAAVGLGRDGSPICQWCLDNGGDHP